MLAIIVLAGCSGEDGLADRLRTRIDRAGQPERFAIEYQAAGTQVLDCFLANRAFTVAVDHGDGALTVTTTGRQDPAAVAVGDHVYLHRSLFSGDPFATEWLRVPRQPSAEVRAALERVVGLDLAGYLFADGLPPTGEATAVAVLEIATDVESIGEQDLHGRRVDGYRVTVDPQRFATDATVDEADDTAATGSRDATPVVDVWLDGDGRVRRLSIRRTASGASDPDATTGGWTADYLPAATRLDVRPPSDATSVSGVDPSRLRGAARATCELGAGSREGGG